ncbi:MAG: phosphonate ABC transporter ATP-binding protein [Nitrospira bacterium SG8_35_4]|nr:MAG: phosphonate ABC transporter ATP-binding protein [Nitrospira bacterium SG8_35_4]
MIQTQKLNKTYFTGEVETTAIRNIDLSIETGEFVAIMGPSGCGKSTLLNLLGLIDRPSSGTFLFNGAATDSLSEKNRTRIRRGNMGFIFQNFNLVDELNVAENVELPLVFMGIKRRERRRRVDEILCKLNLGHRSQHYPNQLSGGQQQRVAFARAIVNDPLLLLTDEPTGSLDSKNGAMIMDLLTEHNRNGSTVLMVTHSRKHASYAHRIISLQDGSILN